jgi:hypothetical protein
MAAIGAIVVNAAKAPADHKYPFLVPYFLDVSPAVKQAARP